MQFAHARLRFGRLGFRSRIARRVSAGEKVFGQGKTACRRKQKQARSFQRPVQGRGKLERRLYGRLGEHGAGKRSERKARGFLRVSSYARTHGASCKRSNFHALPSRTKRCRGREKRDRVAAVGGFHASRKPRSRAESGFAQTHGRTVVE